jgi:hypothetical protein
VESLPRARVLDFINSNRPSVAIPYLKHVIVEWKESMALFHNHLVLKYMEYIVRVKDKEETETEALPVADARKELHELLLTSEAYSAEVILPKFPNDCLEEERAILLGSLGRHSEALVIYLYQLRDVEQAKTYCNKYYEKDSDIYSVLFTLMLKSPDQPTLKQLSIATNAQPPCELDAALAVLAEHGGKVDAQMALRSLPETTPLHKVASFLRHGMEMTVANRHQTAITRGLMHSEHLQLQTERIRVESTAFEIDESDLCPVCHKKFAIGGVFARLPCGRVVHFGCQEKANAFGS